MREMKIPIRSEGGFSLYLSFICLFLLSGLLLQVSGFYGQELNWFELEKKEALFQHAKYEAMEQVMQMPRNHQQNDTFSYLINDVRVEVNVICINQTEIHYGYVMTYRDSSRNDIYQWLIDDQLFRLAPLGVTCS